MEPTSDPASSRPRRRRWRFGLFSLFIFIAIVAISIRGLQIWTGRAHTAAALATTTSFDFLDTPLANIIEQVGKHHELDIQSELPDDCLVTYNSRASLDQVLTEILDQHDCEFTVTFDGTILVRNKSPE
jgi:hypothetical protein